MTMLDRMRRHRNWLKWSLGLVCLAFVIFYIPDFLRGTGAGASTDTIASVNGSEIRSDEFRRAYQGQLQAYRSAYGASMSEQLLKQLGVDQQILQQLIDERAALAEADRLNIKVTDAEVINRITSFPAFQENGAFIGETRYRQVLSMQNPPTTPTEFEESIRRSLKIDKLRATLTSWMSINDTELEREYRLRNEKVKLAVVSVTADSVRGSVNVPDADVAAYFDAHKDEFKVPEKRKIRYLLLDLDAIRAKIVVSQPELDRAYNDNIEQYTSPEQIRASHILFKTEGKDDAAVKAKAEDVLKQAKAGGDFAALAKKYSEDEGSASKGGDLDFFGRGKMVPEFDAAAFALEAGQISDLVKTQYGYHIIKVVEKKQATTKPLAEVRDQLTDQIAFQRAQTQAADLGDKLAAKITKASDLDSQAAANGLQVQESGFFAKDEPILGLGATPDVSARAFELKEGEVSGEMRTSRGIVFFAVSGHQDPYIPKLDEVKERVRETLVKQRARDLAKQKATELAAKLKSGGDFEKAAKAAGVEAKTTEFLARDAPIPDLGNAPEVMDKAFALAQGAVSDPIATDNGAAVIKVIEKEGITPEDVIAHKDEFRDQLLNDRRNRFFSTYLNKAKAKMKISVNRDAVQRIVG